MDIRTMKQEIALTCEALPLGQTRRIECPMCGAQDMTATRNDTSTIAYMCHRASCGVSGYTGGRSNVPYDPVVKEGAKYTGDILALEDTDIFYFQNRFGINFNQHSNWMFRNSYGEYVMPVLNPYGGARGHVIRRGAWKDRPDMPKCPLPNRLPKVRSFKEFDGDVDPMLSWYPGAGEKRRPGVVIVEDQLSAMKVATRGIDSVALLGTHMNHQMVREMQRYGQSPYLLALDEDATERAFKLARTWGMGFSNFRVVVLYQDLKDVDNILQALGFRA